MKVKMKKALRRRLHGKFQQKMNSRKKLQTRFEIAAVQVLDNKRNTVSLDKKEQKKN